MRLPKKNLRILLAVLIFVLPVSRTFGSDGLKSLADKLKERIKDQGDITLAVLNFPYARGSLSTGSFLVSERLVTYLVQQGAAVIERRLLEKLLEEQAFWETGAVDSRSVKKIGELSGVNAVVVGSLEDLPNDLTRVAARMIRVDTGQILGAATVTIPRVWLDEPRLPGLANLRTPVPFSSTGMGLSSLEKNPNVSPGKKQSDRSPASQTRYHSAPVPFSLPSVHNLEGGSF